MKPGLFRESTLGEAGLLQCAPEALDEIVKHGGVESISQYALQSNLHIRMCSAPAMRRRMERTPDERREILRQFINERFTRKVAQWAKSSGVDKNSIYNFLNGHSQSLDHITYAKLARTAQVPVHMLTGETPEPASPTTIWVAGHVEAGQFREAVEWDRSQWYAIDVPVEPRFRRVAKALEIRGTSMNLEYPPGSVVVWVDVLDFRAPRHLDHVIVYSCHQDDSVEATVKELRNDTGEVWLWPRSADPSHQLPINPGSPPDGIRDVEIKGIVIGSYRSRIN